MKESDFPARYLRTFLLCVCSFMSIQGFTVASAADPVVSNVRASQRSGTKLVDIYYDVADADSPSLGISVAVSDNGGTTYAVPASSFSGDWGPNVPTGTGKHIVWDAGTDWNGHLSSNMRFQVTAQDSAPAPTGRAGIPAGSFTMGDSLDGNSYEQPTHTVYVSAFYVAQYEVTKKLWDEVKTWATAHGYSFDNVGSGIGATYPVQTVNWYDVVKWCNARSEKEGRVPAYYTDAAQKNIYKTGQVTVQNNWVKWNAGYRLPTEAEWEKAARGGLNGKRYPWGDTINQSQANYSNSSTTSVGSYPPNGFQLYDMAGNVWELCWDWNQAYPAAPQSDPRGPSSGTGRVDRGGGWDLGSEYCRVSYRHSLFPYWVNEITGFRCAMSAGALGNTSSAQSDITTLDTGNSLAIESLSFSPEGITRLQSVRISFRVRNLMNSASSAATAHLRLSQDSTLSASDPALAPNEVNIPALAANATKEYSLDVTVPANLTPGAYFLVVQITPAVSSMYFNLDNCIDFSSSKLSVVGSGPPVLGVYPSERTLSANASIALFTINNLGGGSLSWSASDPTVNWIRFVGGTSAGTIDEWRVMGASGDSLMFVCYTNTTSDERSTTLQISAPNATPSVQTITITQLGAPQPAFKVSKFAFSTIAPQTVDVSFYVTITALNDKDQVQTVFNGRVDLSEQSGLKLNLRYAELVNGTWSGRLVLDRTASDAEAVLVAHGNVWALPIETASNPFKVQASSSGVIKATIQVVLNDRTPVAGANVSLERKNQAPLSMKSDDSGLAVFEAQSGLYDIKVEKPGYVMDSIDPMTLRVQGFSVYNKITLEVGNKSKPPVILVPGIMGSTVRKYVPSIIPKPSLNPIEQNTPAYVPCLEKD